MSRRKLALPLCLVLAAIGLVGLFVGLFVDPRRTAFAYLAAWTTGVTIGVGALLLLMAGHASKAGWIVVFRRSTEAVASVLPLHAILFVPVALELSRLYPWVLHPDPHKARYLSPAFFVARSALYLAVFIVVNALLRRWSVLNDVRPSMRLVHRMRILGGGGLPLVALVLTWAAFDWTMSLQPDWPSTIFGLYVFAGAFVGAIALVAVVSWATRSTAGRGIPSPDHAQALGRLLFAMVCFWAYMAFSQLLIQWIADIPEEITFYARRTMGSWWVVTAVLIVGHFVAPFFVLLVRSWKRSTTFLAAVGACMVAVHYVDVYWLVMPVCDAAGVSFDWLDVAAILFVGGLSAARIMRRFLAVPRLPVHGPELAEGLDYEAAI